MYNYSINLTYLDIDDDKQDTQYRKELLDVFDIKQYEHEKVHSNEYKHFMPYDADRIQNESDLELEESHHAHKKALK